jgi:cell division protein FtsL
MPSLRLVPVLLIAAAAIVVIGLLQVIQTSEATTARFAIQRMERQRLELEASVRDLEADDAALSSLERVEREAARLGLQPPVAERTIEVNVPAPDVDANRLPSRYAGSGQEGEDGSTDESAWWEDLLDFVPFR